MFRTLIPFLILARFFAVLVSTVLIGACQTPRHKEFESIHGGMSKSEVLAIMGGPNRTQRWHGRDRWVYLLYGHPDGDVAREVHFENGKSTYVGAAIKPAVSADEQDRLNLLSDRSADAEDRERAAQSSDGITVQKFRPVEDQ